MLKDIKIAQEVLSKTHPNENILKIFKTDHSIVAMCINVSRRLGKDFSVFVIRNGTIASVKNFKKGSLKNVEKHALRIRDSIIAQEKAAAV